MVVGAEYTYFDQGSLSSDAYDFIEDARRNYGNDIPFYIELCRGADRILELGTGTGRVAWALAQAGYEVCGLDLSRGMLARAEAKRKRMTSVVQSRCRFVQGDMAEFSLPDEVQSHSNPVPQLQSSHHARAADKLSRVDPPSFGSRRARRNSSCDD